MNLGVAAMLAAPGPGPAGDALPLTGRIMAVDLGEVRIGLAVSDPGQTIAAPAETLEVPRSQDGPAIDAVVAAADRHEVAAVVVGDPRRPDGTAGASTRRARRIAERVRARTGLPVLLVDERYTTVEAERVMLDQDASRAQRRRGVDRVAASVLLQTVLERQRHRRSD